MRLLTLLLVTVPSYAADELTVYDLLAPETHKVAIICDVSATTEGATYYLNPARHGSVADKGTRAEGPSPTAAAAPPVLAPRGTTP